MATVRYAKIGSIDYYTYSILGWVEVHSLWAKDFDGNVCTIVKFEKPEDKDEKPVDTANR